MLGFGYKKKIEKEIDEIVKELMQTRAKGYISEDVFKKTQKCEKLLVKPEKEWDYSKTEFQMLESVHAKISGFYAAMMNNQINTATQIFSEIYKAVVKLTCIQPLEMTTEFDGEVDYLRLIANCQDESKKLDGEIAVLKKKCEEDENDAYSKALLTSLEVQKVCVMDTLALLSDTITREAMMKAISGLENNVKTILVNRIDSDEFIHALRKLDAIRSDIHKVTGSSYMV